MSPVRVPLRGRPAASVPFLPGLCRGGLLGRQLQSRERCHMAEKRFLTCLVTGVLGWHRFLSFTLGYTHGRAGWPLRFPWWADKTVCESAYLKGKGSDLTAPTLSEDRKQTDKPVCLSGLDPVNRRGQGVSPTIVSLNSRCSLRSHVVGENDDRDSLPRD